jgi:hypothetical protein
MLIFVSRCQYHYCAAVYPVALIDLYADVRVRDFPRTCVQKIRDKAKVISHVSLANVLRMATRLDTSEVTNLRWTSGHGTSTRLCQRPTRAPVGAPARHLKILLLLDQFHPTFSLLSTHVHDRRAVLPNVAAGRLLYLGQCPSPSRLYPRKFWRMCSSVLQRVIPTRMRV